MSGAATGALRSAAASSAGVNPWLIAVLVAFASVSLSLPAPRSTEPLDTAVASVTVSAPVPPWSESAPPPPHKVSLPAPASSVSEAPGALFETSTL